jgi:hypothetical protein
MLSCEDADAAKYADKNAVLAADADGAEDAHEAKNAAMAGNAYVSEDNANVTYHDHVEDVLLHVVVSRCEGAADDVTRHHGDDITGVVT